MLNLNARPLPDHILSSLAGEPAAAACDGFASSAAMFEHIHRHCHAAAPQFDNRQPAAPVRFSTSVVASAGLERFAYLHGRSGKRYVFSAINPCEASLYGAAVFATQDRVTGAMWIGDLAGYRQATIDASDVKAKLYVHLLAETVERRQMVLADLTPDD